MEKVNNENIIKENENVNVENIQNKLENEIETTVVESINEVENFLNENEKRLKKFGFKIYENMLYKENDSGKLYRVGNFIPFIKDRIKHSNGNDENFKYILSGINLETKEFLSNIELTKEEYNNFSITGTEWDGIVVLEGNGSKKMKQVTQILGNKTMKKTYTYEETGFKRIDGNLCFLLHRKVIGQAENIIVDLSADGLEQYNGTNKKFPVDQALKRSWNLTKVADKHIIIPLQSQIYLAPIISILREEGINADCVVYLCGKSGTRKSSITALELSHFGGDFQRNNFPCSFRDTINNLEKKAYVLKDVPNVIDDIHPEVFGNNNIIEFEKITAMYGDRTGRGRMLQNGSGLRKAYTARGTCIVTGEIIPNISLSRLARCIIVPIKDGDIDLIKMREIQENKEELAYCMMIYIEWIIKNEPKIREMAKDLITKLQNNPNNGLHGRTYEAINVLWLGFEFFLRFLIENQIINEKEYDEERNEALKVLQELAQSQQSEIEQSNPKNMFYKAVEEQIDTGKIYLYDYEEGSMPVDGDSLNGKIKGTAVGFIDKKKKRFYFYPTIIYNEVCKYYSQNNTKFPLTSLNLWRYMYDEGLLLKTEKSDRKEVKRVDKFLGKQISVVDVAIRDESILEDEYEDIDDKE